MDVVDPSGVDVLVVELPAVTQTESPASHTAEQHSPAVAHACPSALHAVVVVPGSVLVVVVVDGGSHDATPCLRHTRMRAARQCLRARGVGCCVLHSARRAPHAWMHARRVVFAARGAAATRSNARATRHRRLRTPERYRSSAVVGKH